VISREVWADGRKVDLSDREFSLLEAFVGHPQEVLSRQQLLSMVWGIDFDPQSNRVDVYVGFLRRNLGGHQIETVQGVGYGFESMGWQLRSSASPAPWILTPDCA